jgi:anti-anti-sigma regulatory factor/HAMP domain-containing protein
MSIRFKLIGAFAFNILLMVVLGGFAIWQLTAISGTAADLANVALPAVETAADIQDTIVAYRLAQGRLIGQAVALRDPAELRAQETRMAQLLAKLEALDPNPAILAALADFAGKWSAFTQRVETELIGATIIQVRLETLQDDYAALLRSGTALRQATRNQAATAREEVVAAYDAARAVTIALLTIAVMFSAVVGFSMALDLADDLRTLTTATERITAGDLRHPVTVTADDEIGRLADAFRHMIAALTAKEAEVAAQQAQLLARTAEIEHAYSELQLSMHEREALSATVRALATPLIPIQAGVLIAPMVGVFDAERMCVFTETLLTEMERTRTHTVIVDVTGMALIDQLVANQLLQAAAAVRLLGARTILVGIRPEIAQSLTGLGVNLAGLITRADLQSGVAYALRSVGQLNSRTVRN